MLAYIYILYADECKYTRDPDIDARQSIIAIECKYARVAQRALCFLSSLYVCKCRSGTSSIIDFLESTLKLLYNSLQLIQLI